MSKKKKPQFNLESNLFDSICQPDDLDTIVFDRRCSLTKIQSDLEQLREGNDRLETTQSNTVKIENQTILLLILKNNSSNCLSKILPTQIIQAFESYLLEYNILLDPKSLETIRQRLKKMCNQSMANQFRHSVVTDWQSKQKIKCKIKIACCKLFIAWYKNGNANVQKFNDRIAKIQN